MPPSARNCNHRNICEKGQDVVESFEKYAQMLIDTKYIFDSGVPDQQHTTA